MKQNITEIDISTFKIEIKIPHVKYIEAFLSSRHCDELLPMFQKAENITKEISESFAAYIALKNNSILKDSIIIDVGCGNMPRNAGLITFKSNALCYAIDPELNLIKTKEWVDKYNVRNLKYFRCRMEDFPIKYPDEYEFISNSSKNIYGVFVHCHTNPAAYVDCSEKSKTSILKNFNQLFPEWNVIIAIPCCEELNFSSKICKLNEISTESENYELKHGIKLIKNKDDFGILGSIDSKSGARRRIKIYTKNK